MNLLQVDLLDVKPLLLLTQPAQLEPDDRKRIDVVHGSAKAIWSLSQSNKNKEAMRRTGCIKLLARLLQSVHEEIVVFTVGTIQQCASQVHQGLEGNLVCLLVRGIGFYYGHNSAM